MISGTGEYGFPNATRRVAVQYSYSYADKVLILLLDGAELRRDDIDSVQYTRVSPPFMHEYRFSDEGVFYSREILIGSHSRFTRIVSWLERNRTTAILSVIGVPLLLFLLIFQGVPALAGASAQYVSNETYRHVGDSYIALLDRAVFSDSALPGAQQQEARRVFIDLAERHGRVGPNYRLEFRKGGRIGANAMALPDGTVIVTDELVQLLGDDGDAMIAVLLHEIGHIEHYHSGRILLQSVGNSYLFGMIGGDFDGIGEIVLGAGSGLINNSFSRSMEQEADDFALQRLQRDGRNPAALGDALRKMLPEKEGEAQGHVRLAEYMGSHPEIMQRIRNAENYGRGNK